jgi:PAS domain S-box-containing protein
MCIVLHGAPSAAATPIILTKEQQQWLKAHPVIRVSVNVNQAPFEGWDPERQQIGGLGGEYINLIAKRVGFTIQPVLASSLPESLENLHSGKVDLIPIRVHDPEQSRSALFTIPYISFPLVLVTRKSYEPIAGLWDLMDRTVCVMAGGFTIPTLRKDYPDIKLDIVPNMHQGLTALRNKECDAMLAVLPIAHYNIFKNRMTDLKIAASAPYSVNMGMMVRSDVPELKQILDKGIVSISQDELIDIRARYQFADTALDSDAAKIIKWLAIIIVILGALSLVGVYWRYALNKEIDARTKALAQSEKNYRALIENFKGPIFQLDTSGNIMLLNHSAASLLKYPHNQLIGKSIIELLPGQKNAILKTIDQIISTKAGVESETVLQVDALELCFLNSNEPLIDQNGRVFAIQVISYDITSRKRYLAEIQKAREAADDANQTKSMFLANMSHELRTPMNCIIGMTDLVLSSELNEKQRTYLNYAKASSQQLLAIINDILDISKIESKKMELSSVPFNLQELLNELIHVFQIAAQEKSLELSFDLAQGTPLNFMGDSLRLKQVLSNLLSNAIKFTAQGFVRLTVEPTGVTENMANLRISITDTGMGIPKDKIGQLFDSFCQVDASYTRKFGGTGLGLAIAKALVEKMGGNIFVTSEEGKGSTFYFDITLSCY